LNISGFRRGMVEAFRSSWLLRNIRFFYRYFGTDSLSNIQGLSNPWCTSWVSRNVGHQLPTYAV